MTFLLDKFKSIVNKIMSEKGSLDFFAVIKRFDAEDKWDVVLSADWIEQSNKQEDLIYIIEIIREEYFGKIDFISKILSFNPSEAFITDIALAVTKNDIPEGHKGELLVSDDLLISEIHIIRLNSDKYRLVKTSVVAERDILNEIVFE